MGLPDFVSFAAMTGQPFRMIGTSFFMGRESMDKQQSFVFQDADEYAFLFENAHLLLVCWRRDDAKFLYLIRGETADAQIKLSYPGQQFTETVLDKILPIFFVQVSEEGDTEERHYVLGSYFVAGGQPFGAYYQRGEENPTVVLFKIVGEAPDITLEVPHDDEYALASSAFQEQHQDFMDIRPH